MPITVQVKFFAILREKAGVSETAIQLPAGATVAAAAAEIGRKFPGIANLISRAALAVNREYVPADRKLINGDEVALLPAVSGGSESADWVAILSDPLPVAKAMAFASDPAAGGVATFCGNTRQESDPGGRLLVALDYEAYEQMAAGQFAQLARRARERWPIVKLVILHRVGRVAVGEISVLIVVATPHRAQAFEACRWLIDTLKSEVAIWKKEIWSDGAGAWVEPSPPV